MSETYSVVGSTVEFSGKVVTVRVDEVVMPGGGTAKREVVEHLRAVAVLVLDDSRGDEEDPDVVLIQQYRHPMGRKLWELPAGLMDADGEGPLAAAQRELAEETGLSALDWSVLLDIAPSPGFSQESIRIFMARNLSDVDRGETHDEEADLQIVRIPLSEAVRSALDSDIVNATAVSGILAAAHVLEHRHTMRSADEPWNANATVHAGPGVPGAPDLPGILD